MEVSGHRRGSETCPRALSFGTRPVSSAGRRPGLVLETRTCSVACLGGRKDLLLLEQHAIVVLGLFQQYVYVIARFLERSVAARCLILYSRVFGR